MTEESIHPKNVTIINIYASNIRATTYMYSKNKLNGRINYSMITVENFNTPLSTSDRSSRQQFNIGSVDMNNTKDQMVLTVIYKIFCLTKAEYTFFSSVHIFFPRQDHILGHISNFNKFKTEIISNVFSDHSIKLEISRRRKTGKLMNIQKLINTLLTKE